MARAFTVLDAGLALKTQGSLVNGLMPFLAGLAGFFFNFKFKKPANLKFPFFLISAHATAKRGSSHTFQVLVLFVVCLSIMAPAMKAMKAAAKKAVAMKAVAKTSSGVLTQTQVIASVAGTNELKNKQVKGVIEALFAVACAEIKKNGNFKFAGFLNLKLKKKPASPAKKGINPFTKEPCVFKAKPASKTVKALAMKKLKVALN